LLQVAKTPKEFNKILFGEDILESTEALDLNYDGHFYRKNKCLVPDLAPESAEFLQKIKNQRPVK
jgi:hypothetical protein